MSSSLLKRLEEAERRQEEKERVQASRRGDPAFDALLAEILALPLAERVKLAGALSPEHAARLHYAWEFWARPEQLPPSDEWTYWLVLAGRGFGKTRTGAETVRAWAADERYVNLIGATSDDARDIMVEGESGILAVCPRDERPEYRKSERKLIWPSGATSLIFTADEPERLRGKQHGKLWCDELAAWRYPEAWDQAKFGLRLGHAPQAIVTTTPRPNGLVRALMQDTACVVTRGTSYDNRRNLAPAFFSAIITQYEGSRLGRQELNAELLEDNPAALWQRAVIDAGRVRNAPPLRRVVVGVDPSVTSTESSDETGIVVAGVAEGGEFYVLADCSLNASPDTWARAAVRAWEDHHGDRIVAEVNNGGDLVELVIRTINKHIPYKKVTASRGKAIRAEPIAALYEQGRVHHVGSLGKLEDQMCDFDPLTNRKSPDRMDALVWALTELSGQTYGPPADYSRGGLQRYVEPGLLDAPWELARR